MARSSSTTRTSPFDSTGRRLAGIQLRLDVVQRGLDVVELLVDRPVRRTARRRAGTTLATRQEQQRKNGKRRHETPHLAPPQYLVRKSLTQPLILFSSSIRPARFSAFSSSSCALVVRPAAFSAAA